MRVIAGSFKGRRLQSPTWAGLRPTSDKLRETLFNVLGASVIEARVLDGYAGTGAVGIEAMSRGAATCDVRRARRRAVTLIEREPPRRAASKGCYYPRCVADDARARLAESTPAGRPSTSSCWIRRTTRRRLAALVAAGALGARRGQSSCSSMPATRAAGPRRTGCGAAAPSCRATARCRSTPQTDAMTPDERDRFDADMTQDVVAVYPGSFDPLTNGHVDIIDRGRAPLRSHRRRPPAQLDKTPLFGVAERVEIAREDVPRARERRGRYVRRSARRLRAAAGRPGHRARPAGGLRLRVRDADGAHEPAAQRRRSKRCS